MSHPDAPAQNFVLVDPPAQREPAAEALQILTLDTPASEIPSEMMQDLNRLMARTFGEF